MSHTAFSEAVGEWYLGVYCRRCRAPVPVFHNPERRAVTGGTGKLTVCCPRCRKQGQYAADEMMSFLVYADRVLTAERAAVNDDHPIAASPSGTDDEPVLELGPELALEDDEADIEPEAAAHGEPDGAPAVDDAGADGGGSDEVPGTVLELGPELILEEEDGQGDDGIEEETVLELDEVLDEDTEDTEVEDAADADAAATENAEPGLQLGPEVAPEPVAAATFEPETVVDAPSAVELAAPVGAPETMEAPTDIVLAEVAARDRAAGEAPAFEPIAEALATDGAPSEDIPLESKPPALEAAPSEPEPAAGPVAAAAPEGAEAADVAPEAIVETAAELASLPEPEPEPEPELEPEIELALTTEAAAAAAAPAAEAGPVVAPASEDRLTPEIAVTVAEPPVSASVVDDLLLDEWASIGMPPDRPAEPEPAAEALAGENAPEPEPSLPEAPTSEAAPVELPPAELEPLAPEPAPEPVAPEPVAEAPIAPPPPAPRPAAPKPAPPKPIAQVYRERWAEPAKRPQVIAELRPLLNGLKARAEATDYDVLVRVTDLFLDYLADVAPERQSGIAIEQYIHAVFALSTRGRAKGTDRVGEEMAATLRALNRHSGLYIGR